MATDSAFDRHLKAVFRLVISVVIFVGLWAYVLLSVDRSDSSSSSPDGENDR